MNRRGFLLASLGGLVSGPQALEMFEKLNWKRTIFPVATFRDPLQALLFPKCRSLMETLQRPLPSSYTQRQIDGIVGRPTVERSRTWIAGQPEPAWTEWKMLRHPFNQIERV